MYNIALIFMKFFLISIGGYIAEMTMCLIVDRKLTNRGFLCGPYIPIYGIGGILLIWLLSPFYDNWILVAILGLVITTALEYLTSYVLEKIFHNKWWDYSQNKFNLNGRICLLNSTLFAIGSVFIIYIGNPFITDFLFQIKDSMLITLAIIFFFVFVADVIYSCIVAYHLRHRIIIVENLKNEKLAKIPGMLERLIANRLKNLKRIKKMPKRLLKSFPNLWKLNEKEFSLMKKLEEKELSKRKSAKAKNKSYKKKKKK